MTLRTEEEAKKRWCPMVQLAYLPGGTVKREGDTPTEVPDVVVTNRGQVFARFGDKPIACNCIASACEWWVEETDDRGAEGRKPTGRGQCGAAARSAQ